MSGFNCVGLGSRRRTKMVGRGTQSGASRVMKAV